MTQRRSTPHCCPVYLHPAAASNPETIADIQRASGCLVVIVGSRPQLRTATLPAFEDFTSFDGGAA